MAERERAEGEQAMSDGAEHDTPMVTVPRSLLAETLDEAQGDLWSAHGEFCISTDRDADGRHLCDKQQERIDELRRLAGIEGFRG